MPKVSRSRHAIMVDHVRIDSTKAFAETVVALESQVPHVDDGIWERLENGEAEAVRRELEAGAALMICVKRDHGSTDRMIDFRRNCVQYEIGNPLTASKMTSKNLAAGLYAPLKVVLYENDTGGSTFEYDLPSDQFGQFEDTDVTEVAMQLDTEIERALSRASS